MTTEELVEAARELGSLAEKIATERSSIKAVQEAYKSRITAFEGDRTELSRHCRTGKIIHELEVDVMLDRDSGRIWYRRHDTGELVEGPMASKSDLQGLLPFPKPEADDEQQAPA